MMSLLHATFTGDEPPDTLALIQDNGAYSLSDGRLHLPAQTGIPGNGALGFESVESFPRTPGLLARLRMRFSAFPPTGAMFPFVLARAPTVAFPASANIAHGFSAGFDGALKTSSNGVSQGQVASLVLGEDYDFLIVPRAQGAYLLAHETAAAKYRLLWVSDKDDSSDLWLAQSNTTAQGEIESITLDTVDDAKWLSPYGLATFHEATPADGEIGVMGASAFVEFTWKVGAGEVLELQFRRTDDDNMLLVRCWSVFETGTVALVKRANGVESILVTANQSFKLNSSARIVVIARHRTRTSEEYQVHVNNKRLISTTPEDVFNSTATGLQVSGFAVGTDFASYPLLIDLEPEGEAPTRYFLCFGDSKTVGSQDVSLLPYGNAGYPACLEQALSEATGQRWRERTRMGYGGTSTAEQVPLIDAELAALPDFPAPEIILYNLGANDMSSRLNEAAWADNTRTLWRALHGKFPDALIYVVYPYSQVGAWNTSPDTYAGFIDALRSEPEFAYVRTGIDERQVLGFDGGVTRMTDPKHPNHAGYVAEAEAWKELLT